MNAEDSDAIQSIFAIVICCGVLVAVLYRVVTGAAGTTQRHTYKPKEEDHDD